MESVDRSAEGLRGENERLRRMLARAKTDAALNAVMQRESDHRIKNSLQIIVSLLRLQARSAYKFGTSDALLSAAGRIQIIARVHESLMRTGDAGMVDLGALFEAMCASVRGMVEGTGIALEAHLEPAEISAISARSVMLAANELLINAIRHAYPRGRTGIIQVSLRREGEELRITVADDGIGIPPDDVSAEGYGLMLVRMMMRQLGGALCIDNSVGAKFSMIFPASSTSMG
jgi:two-component sensor histidine kinase